MATVYEINIMKKSSTKGKQTSYDIVASVIVIDGERNADDRWMMLAQSRGTIGEGDGIWRREDSVGKLILMGEVDHGLRNEAVLDYESWPLRTASIGTCATARPLRSSDGTTDYHYFVSRVT